MTASLPSTHAVSPSHRFFGALSINRLHICTFAHSTHFPLANQALIECPKILNPISVFAHWNIYNDPIFFTSVFAHSHF